MLICEADTSTPARSITNGPQPGTVIKTPL